MPNAIPSRQRRSRFAYRAPAIDSRPIATINTTPMIDMMLVLLILFIVSIPLATHKVPLDLPGPGRPDQRPVARLDVDAAGRTRWNGVAVDDIALRRHLAALVRDPRLPSLHLDADGAARYERMDQLLAIIRRAGVVNLGLVNNSRFSQAIR